MQVKFDGSTPTIHNHSLHATGLASGRPPIAGREFSERFSYLFLQDPVLVCQVGVASDEPAINVEYPENRSELGRGPRVSQALEGRNRRKNRKGKIYLTKSAGSARMHFCHKRRYEKL